MHQELYLIEKINKISITYNDSAKKKINAYFVLDFCSRLLDFFPVAYFGFMKVADQDIIIDI